MGSYLRWYRWRLILLATLKTRIQLRNDSSTKWTSTNPTLLEGEVGVENDTRLIKIGDGTTAWVDLPYANAAAASAYYEVEAQPSESDDQAIARALGEADPKTNDVAIVKREISEDKFQHTAYVYESGVWKAMDGNYNAKNIYFDQDLVATAPIGVVTIPASGSKTIAAEGLNLNQVLSSIMAERKNPTTTQPSVSVQFTNAQKSVEAGTTVTPTYSATFDAGKYSYGPATGITVSSWQVEDSRAETKNTQTGSFTPVVLGDQGGENTYQTYSATVTANHTAGATPLDNLGTEYPDGAIKAGAKTKATAQNLTCFRNFFYGSLTETEAPIDSALIRTLTAGGAYSGSKTLTVNAGAAGAKRVIVAVPANSGRSGLTQVLLTSSMNADITENYVAQPDVQVEGASGYTAIAYKVWVYQPASLGSDEVHKITLG